MKIAFAGKGGSGKTTLCSWFGEYLAFIGKKVWLIDADTTVNLGTANGLTAHQVLTAAMTNKQLLCELIALDGTPNKTDAMKILEQVSIKLPQVEGDGERRLLNLSILANEYTSNFPTLLKTLVSHIDTEESWILIDLEAGIEHLDYGAAIDADFLVIISEPSAQSLETASQTSQLGTELGLDKQVLIMNRTQPGTQLGRDDLPRIRKYIPENMLLKSRMLIDSDVTRLESRDEILKVIAEIIRYMEKS